MSLSVCDPRCVSLGCSRSAVVRCLVDPKCAAAHSGKGVALYHMDKFEEALASLEAALVSDCKCDEGKGLSSRD